jgi:hypothetical protein
MIKSTLLAAALTLPTPLCAPVLASTTNSPAPAPTVMSFGAGLSANDAPSLGLAQKAVENNIACRTKARSKFIELGARDLSSPDSNSQWGTVSNMRVVAWCRGNQVVIGVSGHNYNSVNELRDIIYDAY